MSTIYIQRKEKFGKGRNKVESISDLLNNVRRDSNDDVVGVFVRLVDLWLETVPEGQGHCKPINRNVSE